MQPETRFKMRAIQKLKTVPRSFWIKINQRALRGIPDYLGVVDGRFVALELKVGDNKTDSLQEATLKILRAAGAWTAVVYPENLDSIVADLKQLSEG